MRDETPTRVLKHLARSLKSIVKPFFSTFTDELYDIIIALLSAQSVTVSYYAISLFDSFLLLSHDKVCLAGEKPDMDRLKALNY